MLGNEAPPFLAALLPVGQPGPVAVGVGVVHEARGAISWEARSSASSMARLRAEAQKQRRTVLPVQVLEVAPLVSCRQPLERRLAGEHPLHLPVLAQDVADVARVVRDLRTASMGFASATR